jgi:hypothetical protein
MAANLPPVPDLTQVPADQQVAALMQYMVQVHAYLAALPTQAPAPPTQNITVQPQARPPKVSDPEYYHGSRVKYDTFLAQCALKFGSDPATYGDAQSKITYAASFLREAAFRVVQPHIQAAGTTTFADWAAFTATLAHAFEDPDKKMSADRELRKLKQGNKTASAYHAEFIQWATVLELDEWTKITRFRDGLSREVKNLLATQPNPPATFNEYVNLVIRLDNNHRALKQETESQSPSQSNPSKGSGSSKSPVKPQGSPAPKTTSTGTHPGPMDTSAGGTRFKKLDDKEKKRRQDNNLCRYCGDSGHWATNCPKKQQKSVVTASATATPAPTAAATPSQASTLYSVAASQPKN